MVREKLRAVFLAHVPHEHPRLGLRQVDENQPVERVLEGGIDIEADQLSAELRNAIPGVVFNFSQAIADNVEEAMSGVKGENTIKIVGPALRVDEEKADEIIAYSHSKKGLVKLLRGSVTAKLVSDAPCPVVIIK